MKELHILNPEHTTEEERKGYRLRKAARAVVVDEAGNIALLHVGVSNYYKLPGGGLEDSEDPLTALRRECLEEIGCEVEVIGEIGSILEFRKSFSLTQTSFCYFAKLRGKKGKPSFTAEEVQNGFSVVWLPYPEVLTALRETLAIDLEGSAYIVPRDTLFVKAAAPYLVQQ